MSFLLITLKGFRMKNTQIENEVAVLENEDYQNRGGNYPKEGKPVTINAYKNGLTISFKNTSEDSALRYVKNMSELSKLFNKTESKVYAYQDGDYHDDWVNVEVSFSEKSA